jgi:REP element-mobilizing transposase RayT
MPRRPSQLELRLRTWGGPRKGAGRKPNGPQPGLPHGPRPEHRPYLPLHVTWRLRPHVWNLRAERCFQPLRRAFARGCDRFGFRLVHFTVQGNHIHIVAEAEDRRALSRGLKGLGVRAAKALNRVMGRKGRVLADRYYARPLTTPLAVRIGLVYVFRNAAKHAAQYGAPLPVGWPDPCSSAAWFDGWREPEGFAALRARAGPPCVAQARSWLLTAGWRRHGLIAAHELHG